MIIHQDNAGNSQSICGFEEFKNTSVCHTLQINQSPFSFPSVLLGISPTVPAATVTGLSASHKIYEKALIVVLNPGIHSILIS
jgi:hypothetical protein